MAKPFQVLVVLHPTSEGRKQGESSKIVVPVETVLANDDKAAGMLAGRMIPEENLSQMDRMEVFIRPF